MSIPVGHRIWLVDTVVQRAVGGHFPHSEQNQKGIPMDVVIDERDHLKRRGKGEKFLGMSDLRRAGRHKQPHRPLPRLMRQWPISQSKRTLDSRGKRAQTWQTWQRATVSGLQNYGIRCADGALRTGRLGSPPKSNPRTTRWSFWEWSGRLSPRPRVHGIDRDLIGNNWAPT